MSPLTAENVLDAVNRGWSIIPVGLNKKPLVKWKATQSQAATIEKVEGWAAKFDPAGWAVITGKVSGLVVLDFDGDAGLTRLAEFGLEPNMRTGAGGAHVYFEHPGRTVRTLNGQAAHKLGRRFPGLDVRGDGGYAVFAGRNRAGPYRLESAEMYPWEAFPAPVRDFLGLGDREPAADPDRLIAAALARVANGEGRNNAGFWLACQLRDAGLTAGDTERAGAVYVARVPGIDGHGQPTPYTDAEWRASVNSAYSRPPRAPESREELENLLALPTVGLSLTGGRIIGSGGDAAVYLALSDGGELTFKSLREMTNARTVNAEVVSTTGARAKLDGPGAMDAVALVRQYAIHEQTMSDADQAVDWGVGFMQGADVLDIDYHDAGERWAGFAHLRGIDPRTLHRATGQSIGSASIVLRLRDGSRLIRADWFAAHVRSIEPRVTPHQLAVQMQRVGWIRRGREGRWNARQPNGHQQINWAFWLVPPDWENRGDAVAVTGDWNSSPAPAPARVGAVTGRNRVEADSKPIGAVA